MRIGVVFEYCANAFYRASDPMVAMSRRGHEIVWPDEDGKAQYARLLNCDVVHVYRRGESDARRVLGDVIRAGTPMIYDNDDDFTTISKESPQYRQFGGARGVQAFERMVRMARMAHCFTTTNDLLADRYRAAGVTNAVVIDNHLSPDLERPTVPHDGLVVGWVAGTEHYADLAYIDVAGALRELLTARPEVRVRAVGVDLRLPERYRHDERWLFVDLPTVIGGFDVGIAPLADLPFNRARSDIKLKEYAASGVPWLASPVGPYAGLGEEQGGLLVPDDGWFAALDRLAGDPDLRARLGRAGRAWAAGKRIEVVADRWEQVFVDAARSAGR